MARDDADQRLSDSFSLASVQGTEATPRGGYHSYDKADTDEQNRHDLGLHHVMNGSDEDRPSVILNSGHQTADNQRKAQTNERRRRDRDNLTLTILDRARDWSRRLGERISKLESGFETEMGDAWREQIANEVMDPDQIPQRRDGESMADYRERLEDALVDTMIDPATGRIKPKYQNDPRLSRYAEWALTQYQKREVDGYIAQRSDPSLTQVERDNIDSQFRQTATFGALRKSESASERKRESRNDISDAIDERRATSTSDISLEGAAFNPKG